MSQVALSGFLCMSCSLVGCHLTVNNHSVCVCVWYDGRGLSKEPRERGFLLSALFFFVSFLLDEGSNNEIRAAPTGQVCYALAARMHVRYCVHGEKQYI